MTDAQIVSLLESKLILISEWDLSKEFIQHELRFLLRIIKEMRKAENDKHKKAD